MKTIIEDIIQVDKARKIYRKLRLAEEKSKASKNVKSIKTVKDELEMERDRAASLEREIGFLEKKLSAFQLEAWMKR